MGANSIAAIHQLIKEIHMATKNELLQRAWREFEKANAHEPSSARQAVGRMGRIGWGIDAASDRSL